MIFKPKVKPKLHQILVRAPIFLLLALVCLIGHPTRADAAEDTVLYENMPHFVTIGNYDIIETTGENLNAMFDIKDHNKSGLSDDRQYIAYYKIDKLKSSTTSWSTYYEYWHTEKWGERVPTSNDAAKQLSSYIFGYQVETSSTSAAVPNTGKKTFYNYKTNVNDQRRKNVGLSDDGYKQVGTLHYFSVDSDTITGKKLAAVMEKDPSKYYVEFYISPVIRRSDGVKFYTCRSWYNSGWRDKVYKHYSDHYDQMVRFKLPHVKVVSQAKLIGGQKTENSDVQYQGGARLGEKTESNKGARDLTKDDYIWGPDGNVLQDSLRRPLQKVTYEPFSDKSFKIINTGTLNANVKGLTYYYDSDSGNVYGYMCVGYRIMKKTEVRGETKNIVLASTMIEMHKDSSGDYVPYFADDKDGSNKTVDKVDGKAISAVPDVYDHWVTVKRYDKYDSTKNGNHSTPQKLDTFSKNEIVEYSRWVKDISKDINWCISPKWGITNKDGDTTSEICVDWFYAKVSAGPTPTPTPGNKITLDTYYTSNEGFNIDTDEFPSVDDSKDLEYNHDQATEANSKLVDSNVIATVQAGSPWVSYSVKKDENGAYVLKDGTKVPKKSSSLKLQGTGSKSTQFQNTKPVKQISKSDLQNICYKNKAGETLTGMTTPAIPYIIKKNTKDSFKSSCNNYLYKVVITTEKDGEWTEFTAKDIWGSHTPANGKIVKNKSTNRSYTTYAPFMRNYVYTTYGTPGMIKSKDADWESDAFAMTHFIIPEVRCNVTIKAYYTTTLPVRTYTYVKKTDGSPFVLDASKTKMSWVSPGVTYKGTYDDSKYVTAIMACTGWHAWSQPYANVGFRKEQFSSVSAAEKYYPAHTNLNASTGNFSVKMKSDTVVICIFIDESTSKYFTQVQYVHTADGSYHLVKSWRQPIRTPSGDSKTESHKVKREWIDGYYDDPEKKTGWHDGYWSYSTENKTFYSTMTRAFVSFPKYVSWDDGNAGLYGSLYEDKFVTYEYNSSESFATNPKFAQTRTSMPGTYTGANNQEYYLTSKGDETYRKTGSKASADNADRTPGGDNSLVVYCIYEDIFSNWVNDDYHPENHSKDAKTEEESALPWNWLLPNGYVWANQDIESKDTVDETQYSQEYTNPYVAQVLATQGSAAYNAQEGIPTTDKLRTAAQVPRYLTRGYWNKEKLDYAYKIYDTVAFYNGNGQIYQLAEGNNFVEIPQINRLTSFIFFSFRLCYVKMTVKVIAYEYIR